MADNQQTEMEHSNAELLPQVEAGSNESSDQLKFDGPIDPEEQPKSGNDTDAALGMTGFPSGKQEAEDSADKRQFEIELQNQEIPKIASSTDTPEQQQKVKAKQSMGNDSRLSKKSQDSFSMGNKVVPADLRNISPSRVGKLPDIASGSTKFQARGLIELSEEKALNEHHKDPGALEVIDSGTPAATSDLHMIPPPPDFTKKERRSSQGNDSKATDITKNPASTASRPKKLLGARLLGRGDSQAAHGFTHEPRKELGRFSYAELQTTDGKTLGKSLQTSTIINELRKLNVSKVKTDQQESSSSEEETATQGNKRDKKYDTFDAGAENQERNKQVFRKSYGTDINLPTYYIQDAKVYPKQLKFVLKAVKYILPEDSEYKVREIRQKPDFAKGEAYVQEKLISESYPGDKFAAGNCVLQLMEQEGKNLHVVREVAMLDSKKVAIAFSPDGKWFSLFRVKLNVLRFFKIDNYDIEGLMDKVEKGDCFKEYTGNPKLLATGDYGGHNEIRQQFDSESRFLSLYCFHRVTVLNLASDSTEIPAKDHFDLQLLHPKKFSHILDATLVSTSETAYRCDIAARQNNRHNVILFNIASETDPYLSKRQINYESHMDKRNAICKISNDFTKAILSVGNENFMLTKDEAGDEYTQKTIGWIKDKMVTFVIAVKNDFIFICHKDYDQNLDIESSASEDFKIMIDRNIEPGILSVLDVAQDDIDESGFGTKMVIINTKQERLFYDAINPQAKVRNLTSRNASEAGTPRALPPLDLSNMDFATAGDTLVNPTEIQDNDRCIIGNYEYTPSGSHSVMWPYMTMSGIQDAVWVYCAFYNPPVLVRLITPHATGTYRVAQTYMTEGFDLYYLVENIRDKKFELWYTDLDNPDSFTDFKDQKFEMEKLFEYDMEDVQGGDSTKDTQCLEMFVRSPSGKLTTQSNKKLFAFFLHKGMLWCWINGKTKLDPVCATTSVNLKKVNANEFVIRRDININGSQVFCLKKVKAQYSVFALSNLYIESETKHVKSYSFDSFSNMVTVMFKDKTKNGVASQRFKVYCLNKQEVLMNFLVDDREIIGRFVSKMFTLINGHYYFNNNVYKIRYDRFHKVQTQALRQEEAFDKYEDLLDLKKGEMVVCGTPLTSLELHKMAYFTRNKRFYKPNRLIILPYLHERKIYLNKMKQTSQYFYTTLKMKLDDPEMFNDGYDEIMESLGHEPVEDSHQADHEIICIDITAQKFFIYDEGGRMTQRHDYGIQMRENGYGKMVEASNNGRIFIFTDEAAPGIIHIFALQCSGFHLMRTINIKDTIKEYAKQNIQHQVTEEDKVKALLLSKQLTGEYATYFFGTNARYDYAINDKMDFTVQISSRQEVDLEDELNLTFPEREQRLVKKHIKRDIAISQIPNYRQQDLKNERERLRLIRGKLSSQSKEVLDQMPVEYKKQILERLEHSRTSIFYIERSKKLINKSQIIDKSAIRQSGLSGIFIKDEKEYANQEVFTTKSQTQFENFESGSFTMNKDHVFFWNNFNVWYYSLNEISFETSQEFHLVDLNVDKNEKDSWIKLVRAGSEMNQISIRVRQALGLDCFIIWDLVKNMEIYATDCSDTAQQIFDSKGQAYIIGDEENQKLDDANSIFQGVTMCEQGVCLKSYEVDGFNSKYNRARNKFEVSYGFKFDERHHNWILCNEYIGLSFSFMTLVIRDRTQKSDDHSNYSFDADQYNFIINKRSFLTAEPFFVQNHAMLEYVLKELKRVDPNLLEQLHYFYTEDISKDKKQDIIERIEEEEDEKDLMPINTPLHLAQSNNRSVNIILKFMAEINYNASQNFQDILYKFVDNPSFNVYMANLPFQTTQMKKKYTLQVSGKYNDHIVSVKGAPCQYVDNEYFKNKMDESKENTSYNNYPVKLTALRMQWIFETHGKLLLEEVLNSSDLSIYNNKTMVVIIEFLYQYYRNKVLRVQLPIYFIQCIIFMTAILLPFHSKSFIKDLSAVANLLSSLYTLAFIGINTYLIPGTYFKSQWAYFEIVYFILNFIISIGLITTNPRWFNEDEQLISLAAQRQAICFMAFIICSKSLYFMQIIDQIANIVTVIFLIIKDIFWFVIIFCIFGFSFSLSFMQLGANQLEFDGVTVEDLENQGVNYTTLMGSISHTFQIALGQFNIGAYSLGKATQEPVLYVLWVATIFFLMIHLLNFLIAIMGQTFADNNEVKEQDTTRSHLRFVLSNWWMNPIPHKDTTQYLITAFLKEGDDDDDESEIQVLQNQINEIKTMVNDQVVSRLYQITNKY